MSSVPDPAAVFSVKEKKRIQRWVYIYQKPLLFFLHGIAKNVFNDTDMEYFRRTGVSERDYFEWLLQEERRYAALSFTEVPSGGKETMFNYAEADRKAAYAAYESRILAEVERVERRLPFKGYVARRFGLWS